MRNRLLRWTALGAVVLLGALGTTSLAAAEGFGNPHQASATGNPHAQGTLGNPHVAPAGNAPETPAPAATPAPSSSSTEVVAAASTPTSTPVQTGKPANGTVGNADNKSPKGQKAGDKNKGYECDDNKGVGQGNPAHSGCPSAPTSSTTTSSTTSTTVTTATTAGAQVLGVSFTRGAVAAAGQQLPRTGGSVAGMVWTAALAVVLGALLLAATRFRLTA